MRNRDKRLANRGTTVKNIQTFKQFVTNARRDTAKNCDVTIKEVEECYPDSYYLTDYANYVDSIAKTGVTLTKVELDKYYETFGGNALRLLLKFNQNVAPLYYVHPDYREKGE